MSGKDYLFFIQAGAGPKKREHDLSIALLFEHKSYKVKHPHLQLLRYLLNIWQAQIKQNKQLTPVIPIIVYHGKERWSYQPFESSFPGIDELLACYLPRFDYRLIDLGCLSDQEIKLRVFSKVALKLAVLVMKDHRNEDLVLGHFRAIKEIKRLKEKGAGDGINELR